jgi:predicted transcriptional regulator
MINESFLQSAVRIRREYLKISNNMALYHNRAKEVISILEESVEKLEKIQSGVEDKSENANTSISKVLEVIKDIEEEGVRLESLVEPMNKEIERLSKEETELYRQIKEKHSDLTEDQIVESVRQRLTAEGIY